MKKKLFLILCLSLSSIIDFAQGLQVNKKWGKPTQQELTMTEYATDPDADAVILYNKVETYYTICSNGFLVTNQVRCRIKVLKPDGKEWGNVSIGYWDHETNHEIREKVVGLKGISYNMENGTVVKAKLESSMIHEERLDKEQKQIKFSMPKVQVGTVMEYEYRIESEIFYDLRDWYAQSSIPVLYTEYSLSVPEWFKFSIEESGVNRLDKEQGGGSINLGNEIIPTNDCTFIGQNLPALKDDDFVWHAKDFGSKITHELRGIYVPGQVLKNYTANWEDIDKTLSDDTDFGGRLKKSSPLKEEIAASDIPSIADKKARALAVFQLLQKKVRWNGEYAFEAKSASKLLKEGTGTNADINFLYINMLRDAGVEAMPVLLRKRSRGRLPLTHASIKYLSTFVVGIQDTDSTLCYIDASVEAPSLNILPPELLVERARVYSPKGQGFWVDLQKVANGKEKKVIQGKLDSQGLLTGLCNNVYKDEEAAWVSKKWREAKDSLSMISSMKERDGIDITKYQRKSIADKTFTVRETIGFTKQFDTAGDQIYLNPLVLIPMKENPFKSEKRDLPVEFPYCQQETLNVMIELPAGYQVEDIPSPIALEFDGMTARVIYRQQNNQLAVQYRMEVSKLFYYQNQYADLRSFFDKIVESCNQILTVKKL